MTKQDIVNQTAQATGQSKAQTAETINKAISIIQQAVSSGITVSIKFFISITLITKKPISGEITVLNTQSQSVKVSS
ncbi:HU family DNA-binding protein [Sulfurimonas sp. SAG-AH-194-C21]|nr:HU family DNA-binding protein [Sulfurimonas sp. SAG-AH-194-C21]MDF1883693.1 HU family DNA-binding protein [Sulfurimonas sp. SAG-AH-194-C21]